MTKRLGFYFLLLSAFLSTATAQSTIFIVRHAEKADATKDPDLSEAGRARSQQFLNVLSIQTVLAFQRFDLGQNRGRVLAVTRDRSCFAPSGVTTVGHCHDHDACFRASPAGNAKRFVQRPALFLCVENERTGTHSASGNANGSGAVFGQAPQRRDYRNRSLRC